MAHPGPTPSSGGDPSGIPTGGAWAQGQPPYGAQPPYAGHLPAHGFGYPPPQRTNGMAIASMVLGILWLYWIGSVLALVFGYVARGQMYERDEGGSGMATAGIVLGWIGVGLFVVLLVLGIASAYGL